MTRKRYWALTVLLCAVCYLAGIFSMTWQIQEMDARLLVIFSENVTAVRQGKLAGALVAATNNETIIEAWEEICSDVIRTISEGDYGR